MVQIISGRKGKGKTKYLLDKANAAVNEARGSIVYLDKSKQHMHELNYRVRLIDVFEFPIRSYGSFIGFLCGIISQDHDIEQIYLDSFLRLAHLSGDEISDAINDLEKLSEQFGVTFILSVSEDNENLPANAQAATIIAL